MTVKIQMSSMYGGFVSKEDITKFWDELKFKYGTERSEDIFSIEYPPDYKCKDIDQIVKTIRNIERESMIGKYDGSEWEDLKYKLDSINSDTYNLDSNIEDVRTTIEEVRTWGQEWKDLAKKLVYKYNINIEEL